MSNSATQDIVILGGNFAGIGAAHYLLKHTLPALQRLSATQRYHITLVTPNSHFYFKIAGPRALIDSKLIPESKYFRLLNDGFAQYSGEQFTLKQGVASALNTAERKVTVSFGEETTQLAYDILIISTGTTSNSALWTLHNDETTTINALKEAQNALPNVKTVLIGGGGTVGVETAGEIAVAFPSVDVTLLSGGKQLLAGAKSGLGEKAEQYLKTNAHTKVEHGIKVTESSKSADGKTTVVKLSDGSERTVDLYIDSTGGKPNSEFLPQDWLDESGRVKTKDAYFRVAGNGDDAKGIYAVGDVVAGVLNTALSLDAQVPCVCSSIGLDISNQLKQAGFTQSLGSSLMAHVPLIGGKYASLQQREYKPLKDTLIVPIGKDGGVGTIMGFSVPSFFVKQIKSKSYLIEQVEPTLTGAKW